MGFRLKGIREMYYWKSRRICSKYNEYKIKLLFDNVFSKNWNWLELEFIIPILKENKVNSPSTSFCRPQSFFFEKKLIKS